MRNRNRIQILAFIVIFFTIKVQAQTETTPTVQPWQQPHALDTIIELPENNQIPPDQPIPTEEKDTILPPSAIPWFTEAQLQNPFITLPNYIDTTLFHFQHYDFAAENQLFYAHKGNPGKAHRSLIFQPDFSQGIRLNQAAYYGSYLFEHDNLRFYRPLHVYSELFYVTGSDREQLFNATHAQKLDETFFLNFQYRLVNTPGIESRRNAARNANFYISGDFLSKDKRYQALTSIIINRIFNHEGGGLINPSAFEQDENRDSLFLYHAQSRYRDVSFNLRHFYQTGFFTRGRSERPSRFINLGRINHDFTYSRSSTVFEDNFRPYPFFDFEPLHPNATFDSTVVHQIKNMISWSNAPLQDGTRSFPFNLTGYLKLNNIAIQQPEWPAGLIYMDTIGPLFYYSKDRFSQVVQGFTLDSDRGRFLSIGGYANVTLGGYNDQDFNSGAYFNLGREDQKRNIRGMVRFSSLEAPYFYNNFVSNYIRWQNNFSKTRMLNFRGLLESQRLSLEGNYYLLENMVYMGNDALPVQNTTGFGFFDAQLRSDLELGPFGLRNHIIFQKATTDFFEDFPLLMSYHSLYMNLTLFEGALVNQFGFDVFYNTDYNAMAYMPVTRSFYTQNRFQTKDFYMVDAFLNAKIKRARIFLKYQNIMGLVLETRPQYMIPYYPIPERMFKLGISWMFFN